MLFFVPFLTLAHPAQIPDPGAFSKDLAKLFETNWPQNRTVNIVCHGHSVPAGFFKTPVVQTFDAYPHLLHLAIKKKFPFAVVNVIVTAIGGENCESGAARFAREVLPLKPDVVTIDYALNDRGVPMDRVRAAWEKMISTAQTSGVKVVLLTPSWDLSTCPDPSLQERSVLIRELAAKYGTGLADSYEAFLAANRAGADMNTLMSQVNHPNRAGHELILKGLLPWFGVSKT